MSIEEEKSALRKTLRKARQAIQGEARTQAESAILNQLLKHTAYQDSLKIALYKGNDGEPDLFQLLQNDASKQFYLPKIAPEESGYLIFQAYHPDSLFERHWLGVDELVFKESDLISPEHLDLVIFPLVGFDEEGFRLGRGGGFYDQTFSFAHQNKGKPHRIGLAFEVQKVKKLPHEAWDIPLDAVVTEKATYQFK